MKCLYLALCLAEFTRGRKGLAHGFAPHLACQAEVWAMVGLMGLMTAAVGLTAAPATGGDGTAPKITQLRDLRQHGATLLLQPIQRKTPA